MTNGHDKADDTTPLAAARRDGGVTFIEILVAVVLLGTVVVAVLAALTASIRGSVAHDEKIRALAVLEAGSAALVHTEVCDAAVVANYRTAARGGVVDAGWSTRLDVVSVDCVSDPDLHEVTLSVTKPRGGVESLEVTVGGPRVGPADVDGVLDVDPPTEVSCAATSLVASPSPVALADSGVLSQQITVTATTDAVCEGGILWARFSPAPLGEDPGNPGNLIEVEVPFQAGVVEKEYFLTLSPGVLQWEPGPNDVAVVYVPDSGSSVPAGSSTGLFELTCPITASVDNAAPLQDPSGRLNGDLALVLDVSPVCTDPAPFSFRVDTGVTTFVDVLFDNAGTWEGTIAGEPTGPLFSAGTKLIEFLDADGAVITSLEIEVVAP